MAWVPWRRGSEPLSMSTTLTLWYAFSAFFVVTIGTVVLYWSLVKTLEYQDSEMMSDRLQTIRMLLAAVPRNPDALHTRIEHEWTAFKYERLYVRVVESNGHVLTQTPGMGDDIQDIFREMTDRPPPPETVISLQPAGRRVRFIAAHVPNPLRGQESVSIEMILDRSHAERFLAIYRERLYLVLAIAFFVCAAVGHRLATQAVMPIRQVGITAARISSSTLSERLQLTELPQELAAVARSFNAMMDRLQDAFSRLSRFSADIAHELRTPVSNMIGEMEVALGRHREEPFYRDAIGSALEECQRLSRVIDALLFLARAEDPRRQIRKEKVNLLREIQSVLDFYEAAASESGLSFQVEIPETLELAVERTLFHRAIANVISNAIKHARSTSPVQIKAAQADRAVEIEIRDQGQGISPEHLPHLSDRFYRVDASRSQDSGGSGLGLAIVKTIAHIHGGELILASQPGLGTRVILRFPV